MWQVTAELFVAGVLVKRYPRIAFALCKAGPVKALAEGDEKLARAIVEIGLSALLTVAFEACPYVAILIVAVEIHRWVSKGSQAALRRRTVNRARRARTRVNRYQLCLTRC